MLFYFCGMDSKELAFFLDACRKGEVADVTKMCELFPELINAADAKGFTPLIIAVYNNQSQVVKVLLQNGANPNAQDLSGNTALMGASFKGFKECANLLIEGGADVNIRNGQGAPALIFAATFGQLEIAKMLLTNGADKNFSDSRGKTPFDHARMQENEALMALLQD